MPAITEFLEGRFHPSYSAHLGDLLSAYETSGLAPPNLVRQVTSGDEQHLWAHVWEAILYQHLSALGFRFREGGVKKAGQLGPDFGVLHEGKTIWIEAVVPSPEGIPADYLKPPKSGEVKSASVPHQEKLLRWTSVLKDKRDRLQWYLEREIIAETDTTVIAINACRLADFAYNDLGISRMPYAIEATFPVGPIGVPITFDGKIAGDAIRTTRRSIEKQNGVSVPTDNFLDPRYANVGAVLGCNQKDMLKELSLTVVHNPMARIGLPRGILGANKEYVADDQGDRYLLRPLSEPPA
jgi:type I restriction enzyme S subunit